MIETSEHHRHMQVAGGCHRVKYCRAEKTKNLTKLDGSNDESAGGPRSCRGVAAVVARLDEDKVR